MSRERETRARSRRGLLASRARTFSGCTSPSLNSLKRGSSLPQRRTPVALSSPTATPSEMVESYQSRGGRPLLCAARRLSGRSKLTAQFGLRSLLTAWNRGNHILGSASDGSRRSSPPTLLRGSLNPFPLVIRLPCFPCPPIGPAARAASQRVARRAIRAHRRAQTSRWPVLLASHLSSWTVSLPTRTELRMDSVWALVSTIVSPPVRGSPKQ